MKEYHKIQSLFKRNMESKDKKFIIGAWTLPEFEYLQEAIWTWTEKIDGTNIRVLWDGEQVAFKGRTDRAVIQPNLLPSLESMFTDEKMYRVFGVDAACLYGEGFGVKIQKVGAKYLPNNTSFILFDIAIDKWWLTRESCEGIAESLNIEIVPIVGEGTLDQAIEFVIAGFKSTISSDPDLAAEGLVVKPKVDIFSRNRHRIISKVKTRDF